MDLFWALLAYLTRLLGLISAPDIATNWPDFGRIGALDYALFGSKSFSTVSEISAASW